MKLTITDYDHRGEDGKLDFPDVTLEVRFTRRRWGGWNIVRADNRRTLGWLTKGEFDNGKPCWEAHILSQAYRGDGVGDTGHPLDVVPLHLFHGQNEFTANAFAWEATREYAAEAIFSELYRHRAPVLGFGRHCDVRRWADR